MGAVRKTCGFLFVALITQAYTFAYFFRIAIAPIADILEHDFDATSSQLGLCASALSIGYFSMQIPSGMLLQVYSAEFVSSLSSMLVGLSAVLFVLAPNIEMATLAQFLNGVSQAPLYVLCLSFFTSSIHICSY